MDRWPLAFLISLGLTSFAFAAPMPATSSSKLISPELGMFRSAEGFSINHGGSGWKMKTSNEKDVLTEYRPSEMSSAALTVRLDKMGRSVPLSTYVERWQKEYPKLGFDVRGTQSFQLGPIKGQVIDSVFREKRLALRQVVFIKDKNAVVLTCRDQTTSFSRTLKSCNQIFRSFQWN